MYCSTPEANEDMFSLPGGLQNVLRAYIHAKSADWTLNDPRLPEFALLPLYYIMPGDKTMSETIAPFVPSSAKIAKAVWLPEDEFDVYTSEFTRTGFQGGLNWYRAVTDPRLVEELNLFYRRKPEVPIMFLSGKKDWGIY